MIVDTAMTVREDPQDVSFSFAAAGWLKMYYFGAGLALKDYGLHKHARFAGSSAGALVSSALILDCDFYQIKDFAMRCIDHVHKSLPNAFQLRQYVLACIDENVTEDSFHKYREELEMRLEVSVTVLPGCHNKRYRKFDSFEFFKKTLLASCTATPIAGFPFKLRGEWVMDGGVSDFQPLIDEHTITVSPFYFHRADIKPSQFVPVWWAAYPPSREEFERLFRLGYDDTVAWMEANGYGAPPGYKAPAWLDPTPVNDDVVTEIRRGSGSANGNHQLHHDTLGPSLPPQVHRKAKPEVLHFKEGPGEIQSARARGFSSNFLDFMLLFFMFIVVKPTSYLLIYIELILLTEIALIRALLHDILPTFSNRTRRGAWQRVGLYLRSIASFSLLARALIGPTVVIDKERLFDQSFIFRLMNYAV